MNTTPVTSWEPPPEPDEMLAILAALDLFEMLSYTQLKFVLGVGKTYRLERDDYLFKAGDPPDSVHVVMGGAIEVLRATADSPDPIPVAYITAGEAIGDTALFTGNPRRSAGRVPEYADIFTLRLTDFQELTRAVPGYGLKIAAAFACRLDDFIKNMRARKRRKELAGKLEFFDLPTVIQTLVTAKQTGLLTIGDGTSKPFAEVLLLDGAVNRARCGILEGEEAFYQLFQSDGKSEFFFRTVDEPNPDDVSMVRIHNSAMNLLMEAMRLIDEFPLVCGRLPDPDKPYKALARTLEWEDGATFMIAQQVLDRLRNAKPLENLVNVVPCSTFTLYRVAVELFESGQIG
jgi:CRP-like cAMP-binding protein